ncbi:Anthranilate phosphoribosyltransferase [Noviherbaspirillum humi]|uniref:Anthranilate phosphoribosyltransferase n=1 Tax=Noviherbaspirillum humi TaxID=1688639 RepID=A0A239KCU8_9BURK|nr:DNA-binding protein YbiB [Noviherbaspirillum humi]SNT15568.1 Anthranilate phosphoribosyltransferase [Noviherbaspirillum humi]
MEHIKTTSSFPAARFIKEIGRGKKGARSLSREDARELYAAMLDGRVTDLELGAIVLAMRIKGESTEEIAGFLDAAEASFERLPDPPGEFAPVVIPSYNGSRSVPNLTPLLTLLLAREGVPVLVHGVTRDADRVTTAEIFEALSLPFAHSADEALQGFAAGRPVFMPIASLAPNLAGLLALRRVLGVRNSTHTLVKIMQPFEGPALRLTSYTHPEYLAMLSDYFGSLAPVERGDAFLMRGTEGETVAHPKRAQQIDWFHAHQRTVLVQRAEPVDEIPPLPASSEAAETARWIQAALSGEEPVPQPIREQVEHCLHIARQLRSEQKVHHESAS